MRNASLADCADAEREREELAVRLTDTAGREWAAQQRLAEAATARRRTRAGTPRRTTPVSRTFFEGFCTPDQVVLADIGKRPQLLQLILGEHARRHRPPQTSDPGKRYEP